MTAAPRIQRALAWLALLTLALLALFLAFRSTGPLTIEAGTPGDRLFLRRFFAIEQDTTGAIFRWSGLHSQVVPHGAGSGPLLLRLRFHGDLLLQQADPRLYIRQDGQTLAAIAAAPQWRTYRVLLPAGSAASAAGFARPLDFTIAAYCPASTDNRVLGVPLDWLEFTPLAHAAALFAAPLLWALLLVWLLALVSGVLWLTARRRGAVQTMADWLRWVALPLVVLAGALVLWAWMAAASLVALLALTWWLLPLASVALLVRTQSAARQHLQHIAAAVTSPRSGVAALAGVWLLAHAALALPLATALHGTATWIIVLLPGALLAWLLSGSTREPLLLLFLGLCGGIALAALLLLVLHILPGAPPWWALLLLCDALTLWHGWLLLRRAPPANAVHAPAPTPRRAQWALLLILLLAAGLRLPFLGSAEFQGDEARAMLIAMKVQQGQDDILLFHRKGPVEVLLPAAPLVLTGTVDEWGARLPFALAGIGTVLGSYLLARHLSGAAQGTYIGLLAALLVASEGFLLAFSRIVQYQSVLVCLGAGALLCGWRFYTGAAHPQRWLLAAAALAAMGMLAHYDGVYVLLPLAFLTLAGGGHYWQTRGAWLRGLAPPVMLGAVLLISFYLPFFTHDQFGGTIAYLTERLNAEHVRRLLFNNLPGHYEHVTFYNTIPYIMALVVVLAGVVATWLVRYLRGAGWPLAVLWLAGSALLVAAPQWFALGERLNWAILALGVPLAALAAAPATPAALRVLLLWFAVPFAAHAFIIADPRTHFYTMNTAAALLVALALVHLAGWRRRWVPVLLATAGVLLLLIQVPYLHLAFLQQVPEFQRSFPLARPAIYRDLASDRVPWEGIFGFPHRDGWKVAGELYTRGVLEGTYHSNQRDRTGIWYTRGAARCAPDPDYFLLATWDGADLSENLLVEERAADYTLAACVLVDGMRMMNIHTQEPMPQLADREVLDLDTYAAAFDARPVPDFPIQQALNVVVPQYELNAVWQDGFRLPGYDLKERRIAAGQRANLTLYWRLDNIPTSSYRGTIEVRDANGILVSHAEPICHSPETDSWGRYVTNPAMFALNAGDALEPGTYTLHARLLHIDTGAPLALADGTTSAQLGSFIVEEP